MDCALFVTDVCLLMLNRDRHLSGQHGS
jgi:hypothetical protein